MNNTSVEMFTRLIQSKFVEFRDALQVLLGKIVLEDKDAKIDAVKNLSTKTTFLIELLDAKDRPQWLTTINSACANFNATQDTVRLHSSITPVIHQAINHTWRFDNPTSLGCNFDAIFKKYKDESRLNELFDSIVSILEQMVDDGHIDSITVLKNLEKIIATIKRNKNGSYFSMMSTWQFFLHFMKNVLWEELTSIPVLGSLLKALETTANEMDQELVSLHQNIQKDMEEEFKIPVQALSYSSTGEVLSFQKGSFDKKA